jgi:hypothetical protein
MDRNNREKVKKGVDVWRPAKNFETKINCSGH